MPSSLPLAFFHAPQSRATGVLVLLEELGAPYTLHSLNLKKSEQRQSDYLAINPMGKVPAIRHGDALVTEQVAVYLYLADLFPEAGLAPAIGDPLRGPYLRWMVFYGSCCEPAVVDRAMKHPPVPPSTCPYGDYDTMLNTLTGQLAQGPWMLGERFTAADVLWGTALDWLTAFELIPKTPVIEAYLARAGARPGFVRGRAKDAQIAEAMQA